MGFTDKTGRRLSWGEALHKGVRRIYKIIVELEVFVLHTVGCIPSHLIRTFFYLIAGVKIGRKSYIHMGARFYDPKGVTIGDGTIIGEGIVFDGRDRIRIGNHVDIASEVMIYNSQHDINSEHFEAVSRPVTIEDYVFIGPRAIILPGVTIGKGGVVAAGAVVTKDVPPFMMVGGVPAQVIGERKNKDPHYRLGRADLFR